uniref:F-box protein At1g70590 n=1 Tax=Anthurium amnicola TaxID=1678845 RepID=A0A1D1Y1J9_9ARAE
MRTPTVVAASDAKGCRSSGHPHGPRGHQPGQHRDAQKRRLRRDGRGGPSPPAEGVEAPSRRPAAAADFSELPYELMARIGAAMDVPSLRAASAVCRSWREALAPLRLAMVLLFSGKRFKHGHGGGPRDPQMALSSFLKGAQLGSAAAMVDAGLIYWEMGRKEEGRALYRKAAELGHPAAQCNLGISYLQADQPDYKEAVKWLYQSALSGYARAQYSFALCLHRGHGVKCNPSEAAKWFLRAAEAGNVRAMYNTSICYSTGEGVRQNHQQARMWMKQAADLGHRKAQLEHGLELFSSGNLMRALFYLELAMRAGETSATHVKDVLLQTLSPVLIHRALSLADEWQKSHFSRHRSG